MLSLCASSYIFLSLHVRVLVGSRVGSVRSVQGAPGRHWNLALV